MAWVGPLDPAGAVEAVARILGPARVRVVGLDGRHAYPYESIQAEVTVSVHLDSWSDVDHAGDLLGLDPDPRPTGHGLYSRSGDWRPGVYLSLYGPAPVAAIVAGWGDERCRGCGGAVCLGGASGRWQAPGGRLCAGLHHLGPGDWRDPGRTPYQPGPGLCRVLGVDQGEHAVNRLRDAHRQSDPVGVNVAKVHVPLLAALFAWMGRRLSAGGVWLARNPGAVVVAVLTLVACHVTASDGPLPVAAVLVAVGALLVGWWRLRRDSFDRWVTWRVRGLWRATTLYRYRWQPAMVTTALAGRLDGTGYLPRLVRVRSTGNVDVVRVRMLPGQTATDWADNAPRLAQTFGALDCRVRSVPGRVHDLALWFLTTDPLVAPVQPFDPPDPPDLAALPVAVGEDGLVHRVRLLGAHLLIVGATGSGKGSVIWSLINSVGPGIRDGLVQVWAVDPKGGMELAPGAALFTRFVYGDASESTVYELDFAHVLEDAVFVMRRRQAALRGYARLHTPTVAEPLVVVVIDELASLTAYVVDRDAKRRITAALSLLLSQGRAVGVSVVGAVQDPRKDVVSVRDLFPTRILLRVTEPEHVALTLGQGARDRGARADLIDETTPGVAYVGQDGMAEAVRVRFTHVTDHHIAELTQAYAPQPLPAVVGTAVPGPVQDVA